MKESSHKTPVHQLAIHMEQGCLGQRRQCLMYTVYDQVCPCLTAVFCKSFCQPQMGAMGLVHDQRNPSSVYHLGYPPDICYPSLISGRHHQYCADSSLPVQGFLYLSRCHGIQDTICPKPGRIEIGYL